MRIRRKSEQDKLQRRFLSSCGFCGVRVGPEETRLTFGVRVREGIDLSRVQGQVIELTIVSIEKNTLAVVAGFDSEAKAAGNDVVFMVCTDECADALRTALADDIELGTALLKASRAGTAAR